MRSKKIEDKNHLHSTRNDRRECEFESSRPLKSVSSRIFFGQLSSKQRMRKRDINLGLRSFPSYGPQYHPGDVFKVNVGDKNHIKEVSIVLRGFLCHITGVPFWLQ